MPTKLRLRHARRLFVEALESRTVLSATFGHFDGVGRGPEIGAGDHPPDPASVHGEPAPVLERSFVGQADRGPGFARPGRGFDVRRGPDFGRGSPTGTPDQSYQPTPMNRSEPVVSPSVFGAPLRIVDNQFQGPPWLFVGLRNSESESPPFRPPWYAAPLFRSSILSDSRSPVRTESPLSDSSLLQPPRQETLRSTIVEPLELIREASTESPRPFFASERLAEPPRSLASPSSAFVLDQAFRDDVLDHVTHADDSLLSLLATNHENGSRLSHFREPTVPALTSRTSDDGWQRSADSHEGGEIELPVVIRTPSPRHSASRLNEPSTARLRSRWADDSQGERHRELHDRVWRDADASEHVVTTEEDGGLIELTTAESPITSRSLPLPTTASICWCTDLGLHQAFELSSPSESAPSETAAAQWPVPSSDFTTPTAAMQDDAATDDESAAEPWLHSTSILTPLFVALAFAWPFRRKRSEDIGDGA